MTRLRVLALPAAAALAVVVSGCGGAKSTGVSSQSGSSLIRSGALAYAAVDSDLSSSQWKTVDKLLDKFPGRDKAIAALKRSLSKQNLDYEHDIKPAFGKEVDFAVVAGAGTQPAYAAITKPDDAGKFKQLVAKADADQTGRKPVYRKLSGGWYAFAPSQVMIDRVLKPKGGKSLEKDGLFKDAVGKLPKDALAKLYVNGPRLGALIQSAFGAPSSTAAYAPLARSSPFNFRWIGAALKSEDNGLRVEGAVKGKVAGQTGQSFSSKLIGGVPANAIALLDVRGSRATARQINQLESNPQFGQALGMLERALGVRLKQLLPLFEHELAFYVRPGVGIPEFTLVLETPNQQQELALLNRLALRIARLAHARVSHTTDAGVAVTSLDVGRISIRFGGFGGKVLISNGPTAIGDYRANGDKLPGASAFKDAKSTAGVPSKTSGLMYLDIKGSVRLIESYAGVSGSSIPPEARANLRPLRSFIAYGTTSGNISKFVAFLEVK